LAPRTSFLLVALASAILFLGAIRLGDLAGYDDAMYATEAKNIALHGEWLNPTIRGGTALEHPPLFVWEQAASIHIFGKSDFVAKLPSAVAAIGTVLLVYWLALLLLKDSWIACVAAFVMLATPYFIKYAGRAMTDVPTTFLFVCAMCAWTLAARAPAWYFAAGAATGMALMTRGLIGFGLLAIFAVDLMLNKRSAPRSYLAGGFLIALLPLSAWYAHSLLGEKGFVAAHSGWLEREVYGALDPPWRRYTGVPEYAWMLVKSYWPWLPAMIAGIVMVIRQRRRELFPLLIWASVVFVLCAMARSRVLRYMLPAYPAFSILSAAGLATLVPRRYLEQAMRWVPVGAVVAALGIVIWFPPNWHAEELMPIVRAQAANATPGEMFGFYDDGQPRWDEANQLEWYGPCVPRLLENRQQLTLALNESLARSYVIDRAAYATFKHLPHDLLAESGHLVYLRLK
jgi:4-amino-4-deoxy-L-arabinose transferase-like glycosyltransferase